MNDGIEWREPNSNSFKKMENIWKKIGRMRVNLVKVVYTVFDSV